MNSQALEQSLRESWRQFIEHTGFIAPGEQTLARLIAAYATPKRHYHNLLHIHECIGQMRLVPKASDFCDAIAGAIWFHDAIYDPRQHDNEQKSAELAAVELKSLGAGDSFISTVQRLILDTQHRQSPANDDGRYMVDIDLSILGSNADRFDQYERDVRKEYSHVSDADFRSGRAEILRRFLSRKTIYWTSPFQDSYESQARANLKRSLLQLTGCDS